MASIAPLIADIVAGPLLLIQQSLLVHLPARPGSRGPQRALERTLRTGQPGAGFQRNGKVYPDKVLLKQGRRTWHTAISGRILKASFTVLEIKSR